MKVLILSCGTGEGHNSAARALAETFLKRGVACEVRDTLSFKSDKAALRAAKVYSTVIKKTPALFGLAYLLGGLYDKSRLPSPIYRANAAYAQTLYKYIAENGFDCVICAHLFAMEAVTAVRKKFACSFVAYGVLTDYTAIPFYKDARLDGWFVANASSANKLIKEGVPPQSVYVSGIPVGENFCLEITKEQARSALNIPVDKKVIAVMSGGAGCGKILKLCKKLYKKTEEGCLINVFTGKNQKLKTRLEKTFSNCGRVRVYGFTSDIHLHLKASDVVLTKPGGLSSTEAAVAGTPIIHLKPIPGCETANAKFFAKNGLSVKTVTVGGAVKAALKVVYCGGLSTDMPRLSIKINSRAASVVADIVAESNAYERFIMDNIYCGGISCGQRDVLQFCAESDNA